MIKSDELYMRRAIELAQMAEGFTAPNPLVGAVIVHHHRIIGEGYHHTLKWRRFAQLSRKM